jgi:hypothetical protein
MRKPKLTITDLFLVFLAILLISVSFYQTWLGLDQIFGGSSVVIALVLSLILLFLLWQIRSAKLRGVSATGLSWIYFFFAGFCFVANFNALYTRFMRTDIYKTELRNINQKFDELETNVEAKLGGGHDQRLEKEIVDEINVLRIQITDPKNQGKGELSDIILARIEKKLGSKLTPLTPRSKTTQGYADLADRYEQQILLKLNSLSPDEKRLKDDINNAVLKWNKEIQNILLMSEEEVNETAQGLIDRSFNEYNKLGSRASTLLGQDLFKFDPIYSETQEVGKIGYAFNHAIKNFGMFQFVVLAGCILLDFGILIIILLMPSDPNSSTGSSVIGGSRRVGKTLITK